MSGSEETLPIFPLSNVVVFPHVQVPLHLFEPRYRQLAADALSGARRIGMVVVPPGHVGEMAGDPPVFPVGCAGDVSGARKLPDGRYHIVLQGTNRFRIVEEVAREPRRLYRVARVQRLDDPLDSRQMPRIAALRARIVELIGDLFRLTAPERESKLPESFLRGLEDAAFVNALSNALAFPPAEKQGLLEAGSIPERFERLVSLLAFRVTQLTSSGTATSSALH
jgi:Lon protease-like protein